MTDTWLTVFPWILLVLWFLTLLAVWPNDDDEGDEE